jgi:hypothetical protein
MSEGRQLIANLLKQCFPALLELAFLLEGREQPVDLAAHGRLFGGRSIL